MADQIIGNINDPEVTTAPPQPIQTVASPHSSHGQIIGNVNDAGIETEGEHLGTLPNQIGTALEGAANTVTFGLSKPIEREVGRYLRIPGLSAEEQDARARVNPISNIAGGIGGFATGIGAAGLVAGAGKAAAAGIGSRALAGAVRFGVEGALLQGGNEVGKLLTQDPNQTVGSAAINVGLSGLIGAGIGGVTGGVGSLWHAKFGSKVASALDSAGEAINSTEVNLPNSAGEPPPPFGSIEPGNQLPIPKGLNPRADQLADDLKVLGAKPTPTLLSADENLRTMEGNLAERGTFAGGALNRERADVASKLETAAKGTLSEATGESEASVGKKIKQDISNTLTENLKPIENGYKAADADFKLIPISDDMKLQAIDPVANHDYVKLDPESASLAKRVSGQIESIENVSDLKKVRTLISSQLNEAYGSGQGGGPKAQILQTAKDSLTAMRESAIKEAAEAGTISSEALENIKALDAQYAGFQNTVKQLGVEGGLGKANNARALLSKFNNLSDESFTKKVFDTGDVRNMEFFKQNFPESFEKARQFKLSEIYDASIDNAQGKNGKFSISKYLTQIRKLNPEAQDAILGPEHVPTYQRVERVWQAFPGTPNTSHTAYSMSFANLLSPQGLAQNLTDAAQYAYLKALPHLHEASEIAGGDMAAKLGALKYAANADKGANPVAFKSMVDYIRATIRGQSSLSNAVKNVFDASRAVLPPHLIPDQSSRDKLEKAVDFASNPNNAIHIGNSLGHYLPDHATSLAQTTASATNFLNGLKPRQPVTNPLDTKPPIDRAAQNKYNRALDVAQQPLLVLHHVKNGTLLPQDVATLHALYPALHSKMIQLVTNELIKNHGEKSQIPYGQRTSLNLLMGGTPLDGTMTPMAMQSIIHSTSPQSQAQAQQTKTGRSGHASQSTLSQINKVNALSQTPLQARAADKRS